MYVSPPGEERGRNQERDGGARACSFRVHLDGVATKKREQKESRTVEGVAQKRCRRGRERNPGLEVRNRGKRMKSGEKMNHKGERDAKGGTKKMGAAGRKETM